MPICIFGVREFGLLPDFAGRVVGFVLAKGSPGEFGLLAGGSAPSFVAGRDGGVEVLPKCALGIVTSDGRIVLGYSLPVHQPLIFYC